MEEYAMDDVMDFGGFKMCPLHDDNDDNHGDAHVSFEIALDDDQEFPRWWWGIGSGMSPWGRMLTMVMETPWGDIVLSCLWRVYLKKMMNIREPKEHWGMTW